MSAPIYGDFIEFEGVTVDGGEPARFRRLLKELRRSFDIRDEDLLRGSYSDLLQAATRV